MVKNERQVHLYKINTQFRLLSPCFIRISVNLQEGCEGTENRLILHILTRPLCLFILAVFSSILRCLVHSFILALAIPVFLLIVFLKITMPRSTGVLGSSRPYWDYVGSSCRGAQDDMGRPCVCGRSQSAGWEVVTYSLASDQPLEVEKRHMHTRSNVQRH
uniref:Uncharacterized protein n=1 Tax=Stegastes partitus TaxID=144197 RepID=A0A3B5BEG5_9TELE